jgi:hypothetical protein
MTDKLNFKGLWKDDKGRFIEVVQQNQHCWIGYIINKGQRSTKVMYDFFGKNKMDESLLMERKRGSESGWPDIDQLKLLK